MRILAAIVIFTTVIGIATPAHAGLTDAVQGERVLTHAWWQPGFSHRAVRPKPHKTARHPKASQRTQESRQTAIPQTHERVARQIVRAWRALGGGMAQIQASSGATATVSRSAAPKFQALINKLEAAGTRITFMGGLRRTKIAGTNIWSKHASGNAIDVCQVARNRVTCRLPSNASEIASSVGLLHGAVWRHPDTGHFEIPGGSRYATLKRDGKRYALAWGR